MSLTFLESQKKTGPVLPGQRRSWWVDHWQQAALGFAVGVLVTVFAITVWVNLKKVKARAWEQLSTAQIMASQGKKTEALQAVDQLLAEQRSGPLVAQAGIFKGDLLIIDGKKEAALAAYQEALNQSGIPEIKAIALVSVAYAFEENKKWAEAETHYQKFIQEFPESFLTPRAYEGLGRQQAAQQKWSDAQGTLERLITLYPKSVWAERAEFQLKQIKNKKN